ncbi:hypothetical protein [Streptomyces nigrescens]|uniref:hypothetical protein n=1 Tax=Streptomyces nigrescens TaxID=1920 RepID=UPI003805B6EF
MSAWAEIVNADGSDEWLAKCNAALAEIQTETSRRDPAVHTDAYRDEVRRECAAELREFVGPEVMAHETETIARYVLGWHHAANHIDPDKGES